ncbi:thiamine phosphate synthase [Francisella orientalis]|uniref:Thiamine-phosphate synthase n=1 Tax=Francisella orientalis TaxID=299583 RepID=A0AAP7C5T1_9GAMM|nr:thiamine phosphate synthase [Francisella orientalis]AFJ42904.1 putative thiamine-phosphate pyrophosphorylase [Francisella orientalis str. Toba 04]AHB98011.1 thiamine-phosphate pyrophosphorylase [Francisella orientalis LADL 07-285A]AKN85136.1 Thiamine-phosphate synthase [Francisella orientalis FNO12]AKN86674.1 Thiamine-phosphate synthase [Francisella orientalis FNO24]AKN88213.1 Thiamine-phosphate synthase [Francisella orientalis]
MKENFWQLTLVTNKGNIPTAPYLECIEVCLKAGITCVQLREKSLPGEDLLDFGSSLKRLLDLYNVPLIVNDNVDLCIKLSAFGVHLGQSDTTIEKARSILGADKIIGLSVNTIEQIQNSRTLPIDYIGVGAIFPTNNKPDVETIWGLSGLRQASLIPSHPIIAIGGIDESNTFSVINSGANGIAAIGAFHQAADPFLTTKNLIKIINEANNDR